MTIAYRRHNNHKQTINTEMIIVTDNATVSDA